MKRKIYNLISSAKQGLFVLALAVMPSLVYSQAVYTFSYTGSVQTINLSTGPHLIEMWGADGGDNLAANTGGKGGYSTGTLMAVSGTYYVYVGGKGKTQQVANTAVTGGFNGGGDSGAYSSPSSNPGASGGGASHIATATGLLSTLSGNQSAVAIVAGGGGSSGTNNGSTTLNNRGGHGGGITGGNGLSGTYGGFGGTQTAGGTNTSVALYSGTRAQDGSFGQGGSANLSNPGFSPYPNNTGGGGGGGWYGGSAALWEGGGGGSGYVGGVVNGVTTMSGTTGFVLNPDASGNGYVIITQLCTPTPPPVSISSPNDYVICGFGGGITTLSVTGTGNIEWFNVPFGGSPLGTGSNFTTPFVTTDTVFYAAATNTPPNSCESDRIPFNLIVLPKPTVSILTSTNAICQGQSVSMIATGNASTYTWTSNGSNSPVMSVTPNITTQYNVIVTAASGCTNSATQLIGVNELPSLAVISESMEICKGETVKLIAAGANTYTWTSNFGLFDMGSEIYVKPAQTTTYTVIGTDGFGCQNSTSMEQKVDECVGVNELTGNNMELVVYPNPNNGNFTVELNNGAEKTVELLDITGRVVLSNTTNDDKINLNIEQLQNGVYFLKVQLNGAVKTVKIVKQ